MRITVNENVNMALTAVWSHRFRSLLTILGIVIGITTVVTVASLLTGLRKGIVTFFQELGPDNVFLQKTSGDPSTGRGSSKEQRRRPVRTEYAQLIKRYCASVEDAGMTLFIPTATEGHSMTARVAGYVTDNFSLAGTTANMALLSPREMRAGRVFTPDEERRSAHVAMIGANLAEALFPDGQAVGRAILVDGAEYTILGVFEKAKGGFFGENGLDRQITIPFQTGRLRYPNLDRYMITSKALEGRRQAAYEEIEALLRKIRRVPPGTENDFALTTADQIVKQFDSITGMIVMISIAISALGLLVGGIGVMNIMLVSVTERTREIGVRKAIGARRFDIVTQFLMEAVTLTGLGGVLGLVFAVLVTMLISALVPSLPSEVQARAVVAGISVSVLVGLFFGVWPAVKASRLDPVDALRHE